MQTLTPGAWNQVWSAAGPSKTSWYVNITVFLLFVVYSCYHFFFISVCPYYKGWVGWLIRRFKKIAFVQLITSNILDVPQETPTPHAFYLNMIRGTKTPTTHTVSGLYGRQKGFCVRKAAGPDGVPGCVLHACADQLLEGLISILNLSLPTPVIPVWLKTTTIMLLPKEQNIGGCHILWPLLDCTQASQFLVLQEADPSTYQKAASCHTFNPSFCCCSFNHSILVKTVSFVQWPERVFDCHSSVTSLDFSANDQLAVGMYDGTVAIYNICIQDSSVACVASSRWALYSVYVC